MPKIDEIWTLDQLLKQRADDEDQTPLIAFPKTKQGITDYEPINGATLNRFVDGASEFLIKKGLPAVDEEVVIGICSPTDLDYLVNIFALIRLGYTAFQLSSRLAPHAAKELLSSIPESRQTLLYAPGPTSSKLTALQDLELLPIITRSEYDSPQHGKISDFHSRKTDYAAQHHRRCLILHSSGSTGLPKPIDYTHKKLMATSIYAQDATSFITMPFSHALCMNSYMQAIHKRRTIYAMSGHVPQTHDTVTAAIKAANPEIVWTVPYVLKLLAEKDDGVEVLRKCRFVSSGGSKLPDELGDLLTEAGVHVGMQFGSTETGLILSSAYRPREDKAWNYLRPPPHVVQFIEFQPVDAEKYECVILDGHKGKTLSNSMNPPNSWHTSDLFVPHATIPNAWKFVGRMDDRITLLNGEKVLPLVIEGRIRQHPLVKEAVVFGIDREVPGLLVFRALDTSHLKDEEFLDKVWPTIEIANSQAEAFSQITRDMVVILPEEVECPLTDKNSIRRGVIYKEFASVIDATYEALQKVNKIQSLQLSVPELEDWILDSVRSLGLVIEDATSDYFSAGMDSLQAIHLRGLILKNIDLGSHDSKCTSMIVYDCGNTEQLAKRLFAIRRGSEVENEQDLARNLAETLIEKYSNFATCNGHVNGTLEKCSKERQSVILTGATGFLGAHILAALVESSSIHKVYAFLRPGSDNTQTPLTRLESSLQHKGFNFPLEKVVPIYTDLTKENFNLPPRLYQSLLSNTTHIIHCAWPVNFAIHLSAFTPQLLGLHALLQFSFQTSQKARFLFCSSIGVVQATRGPATIPSAPVPSLDNCSSMGYSQSKFVGERIVEAASKAGANASILRIGQIIPGRRRGSKLWNPNEAIPLMIRSASKESVGALPRMDTGRDWCSWIEADTLADSILEIAGIGYDVAGKELVYNLVNPYSFSWENELLPALRKAGLEFEIVGWEEWLERLEGSEEDTRVNPSKKLLGFWRKQVKWDGELVFDTDVARAGSRAFGQARRVVDGGFIEEIVKAWREHEDVLERR